MKLNTHTVLDRIQVILNEYNIDVSSIKMEGDYIYCLEKYNLMLRISTTKNYIIIYNKDTIYLEMWGYAVTNSNFVTDDYMIVESSETVVFSNHELRLSKSDLSEDVLFQLQTTLSKHESEHLQLVADIEYKPVVFINNTYISFYFNNKSFSELLEKIK